MKNIIFAFIVMLSLASCSDAQLTDAVVVEQINIVDGTSHKYQVKLHTDNGSNEAYYNTNHRFQVGDTLVSYYEFFEGKNQDIRRISRENDSLKKELITVKYYLEILKERVIIDTLKRR
jgi:hypothetical protein